MTKPTPKKPPAARSPEAVVRELAAKVRRLEALAGWFDTAPDFAEVRRLLRELRRSLRHYTRRSR